MVFFVLLAQWLNDSGEVHLSKAIRKIQIPSEKWDEQGVLTYNLDAIIAIGYRVNNNEDVLTDASTVSHEEAEATDETYDNPFM